MTGYKRPGYRPRDPQHAEGQLEDFYRGHYAASTGPQAVLDGLYSACARFDVEPNDETAQAVRDADAAVKAAPTASG